MMLGAAGFAWWVHDRGPWLVHVVAFVVATYFLFCNVFRVSRIPELIWATVFVVLAGIRLRTGNLEWWMIYSISGAVALLVIVAEMRKPSYHGLGWSRVNPALREWRRRREAVEAVVTDEVT